MLQFVSNKHKEDYKSIEIEGLPPSFFELNRANFFENLKTKLKNYETDSVLILQGGSDIPRFDTDVISYIFLQESYFYYLTGVRDTDFYTILDIKNESITLFWKVPPESTKIWSYVPTLESLTKKYGILTKDMVDFYKFIGERNPKTIYLLNGTNSDSKSKVKTAVLNFPTEYEYLAKVVDNTELIWEILADTRTRKSQKEIELLQFIGDLTAEAHVSVIKAMKYDIYYERDMESVFFDYISKNYYTRFTGYQCVCGTGINSKTLHYGNNDQVVKKENINLMDMGARIAGYVSDVTSTIPKSGKYSYVQKEIYNIVLKANRTVQANMKPGVYWPDMHLLAEATILDGLQQLGLINDGYSIQEMLKNRVAYYFMPHGLGHLIGLDMHDVGGYLSFTPPRINLPGLNFLRTARYLEENNVITVEPGIYFIEFHLQKAFKDPLLSKYFNSELIKSFFGFGGVRIEDNVLVTKDGSLNLTAKLPRNIEEIEALMNNSSNLLK